MSLWICEACGKQDRHTNKGNHRRFKCPKQGNMLKMLRRQEEAAKATPPPKYFQYLDCACGCGEQVGQIKGTKKKHFLDDAHYEGWRAHQRSAQALKDAKAEAEEAEEREETAAAKRRAAEEMAPIAVQDELIATLAAAVPMVTGEASFALWARCLGFSVDAEASAA